MLTDRRTKHPTELSELHQESTTTGKRTVTSNGHHHVQECDASELCGDAVFLFSITPYRLAQIMVAIPVVTIVVAVASCTLCPHYSSAISWVGCFDSVAVNFARSFYSAKSAGLSKISGYHATLPTISASTRHMPFGPLWQFTLVTVHAPRILIAVVYRHIYLHTLTKITTRDNTKLSISARKGPKWHRLTIEFNFYLSVIDGTALVLVAFLLDTEHPVWHELSFGVFLVGFLTTALLTTFVLYPNYFEHRHLDVVRKRRSFRAKLILLCAALLTVLGLVFHYHSHHFACTHDAFSVFSFCEYLIAALYIAFHATAAWDFNGYEVVVQDEAVRESVIKANRISCRSGRLINGGVQINGEAYANGVYEQNNVTNGHSKSKPTCSSQTPHKIK